MTLGEITLRTALINGVDLYYASIPVFLIRGEEVAGAHAAMREIAGQFAGAQLEIGRATGHLPLFEHATAHSRLVEGVLARKLLVRHTPEALL